MPSFFAQHGLIIGFISGGIFMLFLLLVGKLTRNHLLGLSILAAEIYEIIARGYFYSIRMLMALYLKFWLAARPRSFGITLTDIRTEASPVFITVSNIRMDLPASTFIPAIEDQLSYTYPEPEFVPSVPTPKSTTPGKNKMNWKPLKPLFTKTPTPLKFPKPNSKPLFPPLEQGKFWEDSDLDEY